MIYTVTFNPSIDYIIQTDSLKLGHVNRSTQDRKVPGGKGINVSRVLKELGYSSQALGFIGGFTGAFVKKMLEKEGIGTSFIEVNEDTRINVKVKGEEETEINGMAPTIEPQHVEALLEQLTDLQKEDVLVLAGSVPSSLPSSIYQALIQQGKQQGAQVVVDTSGEALKKAIHAKPTFIKPNHHELEELVGKSIASIEEAVPHVKELLALGVENVLVSFAGDGSLFGTKDGLYVANVPKGTVRNSVGAGDSTVAGYIAARLAALSVPEAFQYAIAAGSATAFSDGFCTRSKIESLLGQTKITMLGEG
ncbi:1-phosphofructokinase [Halalkalibacterium ligniniphilum]|uniref:1-phosphofructokinase n=1 Tax=Halalkalibacterium ligniniphilum TaxID=1134413 RepID=UPI00034C9BA3|nr:1-phosphofructokinase [Halalkalibacterium ligniniphilum]